MKHPVFIFAVAAPAFSRALRAAVRAVGLLPDYAFITVR